MINRSLLVALATTLALSAGAVLANDVPLDDPAKEAEIRTAMEAKGFDVRSVGTIDGQFEVYGIKDGAAYEIFLDQSLCIVEFNAAS